jgi:hypothetical protein
VWGGIKGQWKQERLFFWAYAVELGPDTSLDKSKVTVALFSPIIVKGIMVYI